MGNSYGTVKINLNNKLGSGRLGTVFTGIYTENESVKQCAIKVRYFGKISKYYKKKLSKISKYKFINFFDS